MLRLLFDHGPFPGHELSRPRDAHSFLVFNSGYVVSNSGYVPASGECVGILKTMADVMGAESKDRLPMRKAPLLHLMVSSRPRQRVNALSSALNRKCSELVCLASRLQYSPMMEYTTEDLAESKKFLADLGVNCANKKNEWAEYKKMQGLELLALADTIKC